MFRFASKITIGMAIFSTNIVMASAASDFQDRVCNRVVKNFSGIALTRVNDRIKNRLGFSCIVIQEKAGAFEKLHGITLSSESKTEIERMNSSEKKFLIETLNSISKNSLEENVIDLLGEPSRDVRREDVGAKLSWWVCIDNRDSRISVWFSTDGKAIEVGWDAYAGNSESAFYYRQYLKDSRAVDQSNILTLDVQSIGIESTGPTCPQN